MHSLRIFLTYFRIGLLNLMQYRTEFFVSVVNAFIFILTQLLGLSVIFNQTSSLKGWTHGDLIVLVGIQLMVGGFLGLVIRPSMQAFMESIRLGTFDFLLTKPADAQLMASVQTVAPQGITDTLFGVGVMIGGLVMLGTTLSPLNVLGFLVMLPCGVLMVYAFMMILATLTFWFLKLDNVLVIFQTMFGNAGGWPITIFPYWLRATLTFLIPVAFAVTVPAQSLTGRLTVNMALLTLGLAALFVAVARTFWRFALKRYTGASA